MPNSFLVACGTVVIPLYPLYLLMARFGRLDTKVGLIIVCCSLVTRFTRWTMSNFFGTLPVELEEATRVDGCSRLGALVRVILPLSRPGIVVTGLVGFLLCWDEFPYSPIFTSTSNAKTIPVAIAEFTRRNAVDFGLIAALGDGIQAHRIGTGPLASGQRAAVGGPGPRRGAVHRRQARRTTRRALHSERGLKILIHRY
jgi:ABC-type glycerol-3-phosphate transport system permease component